MPLLGLRFIFTNPPEDDEKKTTTTRTSCICRNEHVNEELLLLIVISVTAAWAINECVQAAPGKINKQEPILLERWGETNTFRHTLLVLWSLASTSASAPNSSLQPSAHPACEQKCSGVKPSCAVAIQSALPDNSSDRNQQAASKQAPSSKQAARSKQQGKH